MEIAAVGVSIAIFNQVSKVAIFPLVSITTSFVAEEETIERLSSKLPNDENIENSSTETKEVMKDDLKLENLENGSTIKELALEDGMFCLDNVFYMTKQNSIHHLMIISLIRFQNKSVQASDHYSK